MERIIVRGLKLFGHHGVRAEERERGQILLVDVCLDLKRSSKRDELADTVDYTAVLEALRELNEKRKFQLLESLAEASARLILERFPQVRKVRVRVRKRLLWSGEEVEWVAAEAACTRDEHERK